MLFLDKLGSFLPWSFVHKTTETQSVERQTYTKYLGGLDGSKFSYNLSDGGEEIYDSAYERQFILRTGFLNKQESLFFQNLIHSPVTLLKFHNPLTTEQQYQRCTVTTNNIEIKGNKYHELRSYEITVTMSNMEKINI